MNLLRRAVTWCQAHPWHTLALFLWFLSLLLTRLAYLDTLPSGFHNDEASFWLNAESLRRFGTDEDGNRWPLWLQSYIDPKPALYSWMQAGLLSLFGQSISVTRWPAALAAVIAALGLASLFRRWLREPEWRWSLVWIVITPWMIVVSRGTQEVIWAFAATVWLGVFLDGVWKKAAPSKETQSWLAIIFLAVVASYWYHSAKIFIPLLLGWYLIFVAGKKHLFHTRNWWSGVTATGVTVAILAALILAAPGGRNRISAVGLLTDMGPQLLLEEQIRSGSGLSPIPVLRAFYNRPVQYGFKLAREHITHYSPDFLFFDIGEPRRYWVPFQGPLLLIQLPLMAIGVFVVLRDPKRSQLGWKLLGWTLIAPLPAALTTQEVPSLIRAFPLALPLIALTAIGSAWVWDLVKSAGLKHAWRAVCLLALAFNFSYFAHQFAVQQSHYHAWNRDYADQKMAQWVAANTSTEKVYVTGKLGPQYPYLLWSGALKWEEYLPVASERGNDTWQAGRFFFGDDSCPPEIGEAGAVYVVDVRCELPLGYSSIQIIRFADNVAEFDIRQFDPAATRSAQRTQ